MRLIKELAFTAALTLASLASITTSYAHEIKLGDLVIGHPWSRQSPMAADVAAGYLTIDNTGAAADRLVKVNAAITPKVQLHDMKMDGDVMKMNELPDGLVIPAGESVSLAPGGYHLMFMDLTGPFVEGQSITVTLTFEKAGAVEVQLPVGSPAAKGPAMDHSMHSEIVTVRLGDVA